jgi:hypothetical protein
VNLSLMFAMLGAIVSGVGFACAVNAIAASKSNLLYFGRTQPQGVWLGGTVGLLSFGAGLALDAVANFLGFALPFGMVGSTALGAVTFWFVTTILAPGSNAGLKWSMAGFALIFGAVCGVGATVLALLA